MTSHEGVLFAIVHLHLDKCLNALGQVFVVLMLIVHGRVMLDRACFFLSPSYFAVNSKKSCLLSDLFFVGGSHVGDGIWFKVCGFTELSLQLMRISFCI